MLKNNPFLISSLVFGGFALLFIIISTISIVINDNTVSSFLVWIFHIDPNSLTNVTLAQFGVILSVPAFIFAKRSYE
jgi:hypothetical protein